MPKQTSGIPGGITFFDEGVAHAPSTTTGQLQAPTGSTAGTAIQFESRRADTRVLPTSIEVNLSKMMKARMSQRMYDRLVRVAATRSDAASGYRALTPGSVSDFLDFWILVRNVAVEPEITVAPDGTLSAEWFKSVRQKLDARFVNGKVFFGLFAGTNILEGVDAPQAVADYLKKHSAKPLLWGGN
jgi:hypothetical protein